MDAQQDVTLGEIYRSVQRIESNVNGLMVQHVETRETLIAQDGRIGQVEHYVNNVKNAERLRAQVAQASLPHDPPDSISVKSLIGLIVAIGTVVGGMVAAYFKATGH